ncbi:FAD:protein FMN transferase [Neptunomonas antarctica]|uniref:FAD:protein FMN transferase n=1 Tax=Neptunomonas antarctica TaxID=619304 RepID=A0A1N7LR51_9GAMM|nr:FAD:protein FMN transferase [Neptunomonas antarctica]SIS76325.1 thiamine biosynthesis lipoprotein [Neptunomonas antarctica]
MDAIFRIPKWPAALLLAILFLSACSEQKQDSGIVSFSGMTMGTSFTVKWVDQNTGRVAALEDEVHQALLDVNQSMSTYIPDSELSLFNKLPAGGEVDASEALFFVLSLAQDISQKTAGAFDVTVGPLVNLWGFGPDGRVIKAPKDDEILLLQQRIGFQKLVLDADRKRASKQAALYVDLSAIAKGYGVDVLAGIMEKNGIDNYLVEIGGELRAKGVKPENQDWKIAIESPLIGERKVQDVLSVSDTGIATSGDYRNYFEENGVRYSHTINPTTGRPISHQLASVTVLMPTCAEADGMATAFMVMGDTVAYDYAVKHNIDALFIVKSEQGFIEKMTPGFDKRLVN